MMKKKKKKRKIIRLRLRLRSRGIYLNRITEKVNGYLSSCVPVGRGREGENQDIFCSKNKIKIRKVICFKAENKQREREGERERERKRESWKFVKCMLNKV